MKKILTAKQIREADAYTIAHEPVSSLLLMERAAHACFQWLRKNYPDAASIKIFCGTGNNGGDGLVIADYLLTQNIETTIYIIHYNDKNSDDFLTNEKRLKDNYPGNVFDVYRENDFPAIDHRDLIIDAIFGTGLNKAPGGLAALAIQHINNLHATVIAIDMPSGLFADVTSTGHSDVIIRATHTLTFQLKKLCFYFPENSLSCGHVHVMDIKLHQKFLSTCVTTFFETEKDDIINLLKPRSAFAHKGNFGHALLMCGSYGKMGAAVLSAKACLRSGVGLLTVNSPSCGVEILQTAVPEAMVIADAEPKILSTEIDHTRFNAIGIGCGIGTDASTIKIVRHLLGNYKKPIVMDADALNILALHKELLFMIHPGSVLTPHVKEFARLTKTAENDFERNDLQREFSSKYNCYVLLKGKYSCLSTPEGECYFNPTGNAGMATGGSGDVLTGILTGLLAQGYTPFEASITGVYLHGLAGDLAACKMGMESMIASDIVKYLSDAFLSVG